MIVAPMIVMVTYLDDEKRGRRPKQYAFSVRTGARPGEIFRDTVNDANVRIERVVTSTSELRRIQRKFGTPRYLEKFTSAVAKHPTLEYRIDSFCAPGRAYLKTGAVGR